MLKGLILPVLIMMPLFLAVAVAFLGLARTIIRFCAIGTIAVAAVSLFPVLYVFTRGEFLFAASNWLMLDTLSAYHLAVMMIVFSLASLYAVSFFGHEIDAGDFTLGPARRYAVLWFGSLAAMIVVLLSNNIGILWVGVEATTLLTAFLICTHTSAGALEAMWKYLLMCSVGVAVAFTGTLLVAASAGAAGLQGAEAMIWSSLYSAAANLNPLLLKAGFVFVAVGYGAKAGLAPMHNWLPDAHSQAPAPVSAVFSGFLLNVALYGIVRILSLVEIATGNTGWGREVLVILGLLSIMVAAVFIITQTDLKRFLAYSSIEHIGIIALGIGIGGLAAVAALFHLLCHSMGKTVSFFCAGRIGQIYETHDMRKISGIAKGKFLYGPALTVGVLALIGVAPFAIFLSEFMMLKAALDQRAYLVSALFLAGLGIVFVGALRHLLSLAWGPSVQHKPVKQSTRFETFLVIAPLVAILILGVWVPAPLLKAIEKAVFLVGGVP